MLPLDSLLPLRSLNVTLCFTGASSPQFFHQPALGAFLRHLAGSPPDFDRLIRFDAPECGRIAYQPGHRYRFNLIALAGGEALLDTLLSGLARLPHSSPQTDARLPFRDNLALAALHDAFTDRPVQQLADLSVFGADELARQAAVWQDQPRWVWQWLSPARLLKDKARRGDAKGEARYCRNLPDLDGALLLSRLYDSLAELLRRQGVATPPRPEPPPLHLEQGHLFWLDAAYTDAAGKAHVMGGAAGQVELAANPALPPAWLKLMLLGQYTGIGQRTAFGWGRYRLLAGDGACGYRRCLPAASLYTPTPHAMDYRSG